MTSTTTTSNHLPLEHTNSMGLEMTPDCHHSTHVNGNDNEAVRIMAPPSSIGHGHHHGHNKTETTAWDAWIQLTKAYIGPGCLSLPWAVSQLGLPVGAITIVIVAFWTSYNCWNVVHLKRQMMHERAHQEAQQAGTSLSDEELYEMEQRHKHITYPQVGEWAYGRKFKDLLLVSICVQQLAVCTVFLSFIGENIAAVMERTLTEEGEKAPSHAFVITLALPFAMLLSCLPNLKVLSPVMVVATLSLFFGFGLLGVVIAQEWHNRPRPPEEIDYYEIAWSQVPMAICAILYSYEGICVILPVESAMAEPKHFQKVFVSSMSFTALVFATVACVCMVAFGDVTNGSVTAFLVENLEDENVKWWLYMANTACSVAVLLTYPLQLFPSFELIGPWMSRVLRLDIGSHSSLLSHSPIRSFSPVPYCENPDDGIIGNHEYHASNTPERAIHNTYRQNGLDAPGMDQDINNSHDHCSEHLPPHGEESEEDISTWAFTTPGDSPQLRAILVSFTYIMAIAIPNVQLLVSLAGALSGSATGLIIPPLLELAYVKRQEDEIVNRLLHVDDDDDDDFDEQNSQFSSSQTRRPTLASLQWKKWECYTLCSLGVAICVFGTGAALLDIIRVYMGR